MKFAIIAFVFTATSMALPSAQQLAPRLDLSLSDDQTTQYKDLTKRYRKYCLAKSFKEMLPCLASSVVLDNFPAAAKQVVLKADVLDEQLLFRTLADPNFQSLATSALTSPLFQTLLEYLPRQLSGEEQVNFQTFKNAFATYCHKIDEQKGQDDLSNKVCSTNLDVLDNINSATKIALLYNQDRQKLFTDLATTVNLKVGA